jgi:hypothetical protein
MNAIANRRKLTLLIHPRLNRTNKPTTGESRMHSLCKPPYAFAATGAAQPKGSTGEACRLPRADA